MIWYQIPAAGVMVIFVVLLLTAVAQAVIVLEAGDLLRDRKSLRYIRIQYVLLCCVSVIATMEALIAVASIEGGIFLDVSSFVKFFSVLPALIYICTLNMPVEFPSQICPLPVSFFIPLVLLPPFGILPAPIPVFLNVFSAVWLGLDAARMLMSFHKHSRTETTRKVIAMFIQGIDHGICVSDSHGWILETNPAFSSFCGAFGIHNPERISEIDAALTGVSDVMRISINENVDGKSIRTDDSVYFIQQRCFKLRRKTCMETTVSEVTEIVRAATELEKENSLLFEQNQKLKSIIADIESEVMLRERERLCRAAHDLWSQRLAIAGLSLDRLLDQKHAQESNMMPMEIKQLLETPILSESTHTFKNLSQDLLDLSEMYRKLGVRIEISGQAAFTTLEQESLCAVLREALANAVRHSYARHIAVSFFEEPEKAGVIVVNDCLDDKHQIIEGQGLCDIRARISNAGGLMQFKKDNVFNLHIEFPRSLVKISEGV